MSARTRSAACIFSRVSLPNTLVSTGPLAGNVSITVSDWKRITASRIMGCVTPQAPGHGSLRCSYLSPSSSMPSLSVRSQSSRDR